MQATELTSPDQAIPRIAVPFLALAAFGSGISLRVTDPLLPRFAAEFGLPLGEAANVITFFAVAYGMAQLFFGPVGDRFGKYVVIAWASAASAATALCCALAPGFGALLFARLMAGATAAAIIPLSMAWIGDVVPYHQRQPVLARFLIGQILGLSAGVLAGGLSADSLSWRVPFFAVSFLFLVVSAGLFAINRRLPDHAKTTRKGEGSPAVRVIAEFGQVLQGKWARLVLLTVFLEGAFLYGAFAFIATHLHRSYGVSLTAAGALVMLFGLGGLLFAILSRVLVARLGESGLTLWGGIVVTAALLLIGVAPAWWWALPGCFLSGLGFYMLHNTLQINATQMAPERRGAAVSGFASLFFLGQSAGVALAGAAVERFGTAPALAVGAAGVLVVALNFSRHLRRNAPVQ